MSKGKFYEYTYGTDDPNIQYAFPDGMAPSVAIRLDKTLDSRMANMAEVSVHANNDGDNEPTEGHLYMDEAQLRKLAHDAIRAADLLAS